MINPQRFPAWLAPALRLISLAAGLLGLVMAVLVLVTAVRLSVVDPLESEGLQTLRDRVADDQAGESLYQEIRALDLMVRTAYFTSQEQMTAGTFLFLGAWALALICFHLASLIQRPAPAPRRAPSGPLGVGYRRAVFTVGGLLAVAGLASLALVPREAWDPGRTTPTTAGAFNAADFDRDWAKQWGVFRGPRAGIAVDPTSETELGTLDAAWPAGRVKVLWKVPLETPGLGSPVVWDQTLFLNAADTSHQLIQAFDTQNGTPRWTTDLAATAPLSGLPEVSPSSGLATPTMACDAERAFVLFPTGRLACLDRQGKVLWAKELGMPDNTYGLASSLLVSRDLLVVQFDQNTKTTLNAYDVRTGRTRWETARESEVSWASPILVPSAAGPRIVVAGNPTLSAFRPEDGTQVWQFPILGGEVAPSPTWYADTVYVANQYALAAAVPLAEAEGGNPVVRWEYYDDLPDISSPLATPEGLCFVTSPGMVSLVDLTSGALKWQQELKEEVNASPLLLGRQILVTTLAGTLFALDLATGKPAWTLKLDAEVRATPAWQGNRLFVRTGTSLVALGPE